MNSSYFDIFNAVLGAGLLVKLVLLLLLILSIYSWALIFNKYKVLKYQTKLVTNLRKDLKTFKNNQPQLFNAYSKYKNNPYLNILKFLDSNQSILMVKGSVNQVISDTVFNFLYDINKPLEKRINSLATIGNNAPFIGLFGTVIGIINSFSNIGDTSSASLAVIAPGISEALYATAMGLFVAVPAVFAYNNFTQKLENYKDLQDILVQELVFNFIKKAASSSKQLKADPSTTENSSLQEG